MYVILKVIDRINETNMPYYFIALIISIDFTIVAIDIHLFQRLICATQNNKGSKSIHYFNSWFAQANRKTTHVSFGFRYALLCDQIQARLFNILATKIDLSCSESRQARFISTDYTCKNLIQHRIISSGYDWILVYY